LRFPSWEMRLIRRGEKNQIRTVENRFKKGRRYNIYVTGENDPEGKILILNVSREVNPQDTVCTEDADAEGKYTPTEFEEEFTHQNGVWATRYAVTFMFLPRVEVRV